MLGLYAVIYLCAKFRRSRAHYRSIVMKTVTEKNYPDDDPGLVAIRRVRFQRKMSSIVDGLSPSVEWWTEKGLFDFEKNCDEEMAELLLLMARFRNVQEEYRKDVDGYMEYLHHPKMPRHVLDDWVAVRTRKWVKEARKVELACSASYVGYERFCRRIERSYNAMIDQFDDDLEELYKIAERHSASDRMSQLLSSKRRITVSMVVKDGSARARLAASGTRPVPAPASPSSASPSAASPSPARSSTAVGSVSASASASASASEPGPKKLATQTSESGPRPTESEVHRHRHRHHRHRDEEDVFEDAPNDSSSLPEAFSVAPPRPAVPPIPPPAKRGKNSTRRPGRDRLEPLSTFTEEGKFEDANEERKTKRSANGKKNKNKKTIKKAK